MAHKDKLEDAKRLYKTANTDQRYVLESLFPELVESITISKIEYERLREIEKRMDILIQSFEI